MYKRVIFGEAVKTEVIELKDINSREAFILFSLAVVVLVFGVWPAPIFEIMHGSIEQLVAHVLQTKVP